MNVIRIRSRDKKYSLQDWYLSNRNDNHVLEVISASFPRFGKFEILNVHLKGRCRAVFTDELDFFDPQARRVCSIWDGRIQISKIDLILYSTFLKSKMYGLIKHSITYQ